MEKTSLSDSSKAAHNELALVPTDSVVEGQLKDVHEEDGHLHRSFSPHQVHVRQESHREAQVDASDR